MLSRHRVVSHSPAELPPEVSRVGEDIAAPDLSGSHDRQGAAAGRPGPWLFLPPAVAFRRCAGLSDRADVLGLRALSALGRGELDPLVVLEAAVTVSLDGGVVNEDVGGAVVGGDETIALVGVEPLHCALSHCAFSC